MGVNETNKDDKTTLWSIVIKAAYRKRRSKRRQAECGGVVNGNGNDCSLNSDDSSMLTDSYGNSDRPGSDNNYSKGEYYYNQNFEKRGNNNNNSGSCDDLLKFLLEPSGNPRNSSDDSKKPNRNVNNGNSNSSTTFTGENGSFLNELFSNDKLSGNSGSKLSLDCKGEIIIEDTNLMNNSARQIDWLGLMEGRVYINENMAGTCLQPFSGAYKRTKGKRWSLEQTEKFYDALSLFGTDLMLVKSVFPEFTDKQVHDKFKAEEKRNKEKLDNILLNNKRKLTKEDIDKFNLKYNN
ncbi:transcription factor TFIIIB [Cryptosporidium ryanae]|uniref:transcription factor TFIIIB n=1 Tax=Cryptosporidium ryanae TaxID=515981 RepID=UPI00351A791C|nr:transcription factor TFIIIB [Cryptosporidium ryanae]